MTYRATARVVGGLFIVADLAGVPALLLHQPVTDARDPLSMAALNATQVATGALLALLMGLAVVGIAIAIYPVLRRFSERLALAYVAIRVIEGAFDVVAMLGWLTLAALARDAVQGSTANGLPGVGAVLLSGLHVVSFSVKPLVFGVDAVLLNAVLYRTGLVPRWLSAWGLIGAATWLAFGVANAYGAEPLMALSLPIGLQEVALALWLIFKGFDAAAFASEHEAVPAAVGGVSAATGRAA